MISKSAENKRLCLMVTSGGTAIPFLRGYLSFLHEGGWDVTLITSQFDGLREFVDREGVKLRIIDMRRDPSPVRDFRSLVSLVRVLRENKPEVLVYATPKASLLGALAGKIARVPVRVYELWGLRLETTTGIARWILTAVEYITMRSSTSVVANSASLASKAVSLRLSRRDRVRVLGPGSSHGVDVERFSVHASMDSVDPETQAFLAATSGLTIGFIGRLHPDKGIDTLLDAVEMCWERGISVRLLLIGADEGVDIVSRISGQSNIHRVGRVDDPRPYFRAIDVLVLMSRREGFPNVVLEAASMMVPSIVSDSTGTVDSVVDGVTGYICETGDAVEVSKCLEVLAQDTVLLRKMGEACRSHVEENFTQQYVWKQHLAHISMLISEKHENAGRPVFRKSDEN